MGSILKKVGMFPFSGKSVGKLRAIIDLHTLGSYAPVLEPHDDFTKKIGRRDGLGQAHLHVLF
ncbi:hypothetical protein [Ethanoligenens sp.]|uniref:hypothetical protein n=1 Tax=Ethanoligenens sp. TaxID=2099655 RepID=UPI0039EC2FA0